MKRMTKLLSAVAALSVSAGAALADFPERTIEVLHPWGPGTGSTVSQVIAKAMGEELGVDATVISVPGAAGTKAQKTAMGKAADGHTIFDAYVAPLVLQPILGNADWDYSEYTPLHSAHSNAFAIGGRTEETRWSNFGELMAYCKENRGDLRYSSGSRNNLPHMVISKILQAHDCVAQNVPYTQDGNAAKDLKSGVLDFSFVNVGNYKSDPSAYNILLVMSELADSKAAFDGAPGLDDIEFDTGLSKLGPMGWTWWIVSPDTPADVVDKLRDAMGKAMARDDVKAAIRKVGFVPLPWDHTQYDEVVGGVKAQLSAMGSALAWEEEELNKLK
jgi:tripartite-type tricarboxylate transporter receptor subunit TctC